MNFPPLYSSNTHLRILTPTGSSLGRNNEAVTAPGCYRSTGLRCFDNGLRIKELRITMMVGLTTLGDVLLLFSLEAKSSGVQALNIYTCKP